MVSQLKAHVQSHVWCYIFPCAVPTLTNVSRSAMGKSRSATFIVAYLMTEYQISPQKALEQLCEGRPICSPNLGFMEQLHIYQCMLSKKVSRERENIYKSWVVDRFIGPSWEWEKRAKI